MNSQQPEKHNRSRLWRLLLSWGGYALLVFCIACLVLMWLASTPPEGLEALQAQLRQVLNIGIWLQCAASAWIVLSWPQIIEWARQKGFVLEHEYNRLLAARKTVALVLALYLLMFPIGPARIANLFFLP